MKTTALPISQGVTSVNNAAPSTAASPLQQFSSERAFKDTPIPAQFQSIRESLDYPLIDREHPLSPVEALHELERMASTFPQIELRRSISPGEEKTYEVDLTLSYQRVRNEVQRVSLLATAFKGHLKACQIRLSEHTPTSILWLIWANAGQEATNNYNLTSDKGLLIFAAEHFNLAVDATKVELAAIVKASADLIKNLKATLKQADANYQLGRDQINISLLDSRVPDTAVSGDAPETLKPPGAQAGATDSLSSAFGDRVKKAAPVVKQDEKHEEPQAAAPAQTTMVLDDDFPENMVVQTPPIKASQPAGDDDEEALFTNITSVRIDALADKAQVEGAALPEKVDLCSEMPPVLDQGTLNAQADPSEYGICRDMGANGSLDRFDGDNAAPAMANQHMTKATDPTDRPRGDFRIRQPLAEVFH